MFGIHQLAINDNIKDATSAFHQQGFSCKPGIQFCSQTDRVGFVVSLHAVSDAALHFDLLGYAGRVAQRFEENGNPVAFPG